MPPAAPTGSLVSKVAQWVTPVVGETAQPFPGWSGRRRSPGRRRSSSWLKLARAFWSFDRLGLLGVGLGGGGDLELGEHEVAVRGPARALAGQLVVGQHFEADAGDAGQVGLGDDA